MMLQSFSKSEIDQLDQRFRTHLINTFVGIKPAILLGTADENNHSNLCIMNSLTHIGANPALLGLIFRPHTVARHSLENIMATGVYTINHVHKKIYKKAHQTAAKYGRNISEFKATGLKAEFLNNFRAPFVAESRIKAGLEFCERIDIKSNQTILIIGKIQFLHITSGILSDSGYVNHQTAESVGCIGLDSYYQVNEIDRLTYAKPA